MSLVAVLTTVAAFGTLCFSGFPVFVQLGQFTMLGAGLCFLIVHLVFPRIFPVLPPGGERSLHLQKVVDALGGTGRTGFWAAALFAGGHAVFREAGLRRQPAGHEHRRRRDAWRPKRC